jgi:hypothetical protein
MNPIRPDCDLSVNNQHRLNELAAAAEQRRLVREATEGQPTRLERLSASLSALRTNIAHSIQSAADSTASEALPQHTPLLGGKQSFEV